MDLGSILSRVAEQGFGYILFIGALFIIKYQYEENRQLNKDRLEDMKTTRDAMSEPLKGIQKMVETLLDMQQWEQRERMRK